MKIVVLDDSMTVRMIIESFLEDMDVEEDEIFLFEKGQDALDFIEKDGADLIFSDINMPHMNGYEFAKSVFSLSNEYKNCFFAISGDENRESFLKMKKNGVHRFLKKPINSEYFTHFIYPEIMKCRASDGAINA